MKYKDEIVGALALWFVCGFAWGLIESCVMQTSSDYDYETHKRIDTSTSGCVYSSYAAWLSPARVLACELFRKRFEIEGLGDHAPKPK